MPPQRAMETSELLRELRIDRDGRPPRLRRRRLLLAAAALVVLAAGLWLAWARTSTPAVRTVVARAATPAGGAGSVLDASGYVTARRQATVSAKITGKVTEVLIEEGMRVREGAVLARLDDTEAKAQLALARAQLGAARAQDGEIRAQLEQAERDYARSQELFNRKLVAEQAMDAARAQRDTLRAKLTANQEQIRVATESVTVAQVQLDGFDILVTHGDQVGRPTPASLHATFPHAEIIVYGHTHQPLLELVDRTVTVMNPGSAGPRRFDLPISLGIMELEPGIPPRARLVTLQP